MTGEIDVSEVERWLNDLPEIVVQTVERRANGEAEFHFVAHAERPKANVIKRERDGPLLVAANVTFGAGVLEAIRHQQERFFGEVESVLTNAPGIYSFTDGTGSSVPNDRFTTVAIRYWVYPDGATKHAVVNGVLDVLGTASYVKDTASRIERTPRIA